MITLLPGEKIHLVKRRHRIILIMELLPEAAFFLAIIGAISVLFFVSLPSWPEGLAGIFPEISSLNLRYILLFFLSLLLLILWAFMFIIFTDYYLDCWIVTNQRTIHTELRNLFSRLLSSVPHDRIQDISIDVHGILATFFHFGDLHIQTAGEFREFVFRQVPDPYKTKEMIFEAQKEFLRDMKKEELSYVAEQERHKQ